MCTYALEPIAAGESCALKLELGSVKSKVCKVSVVTMELVTNLLTPFVPERGQKVNL